MLPTTDIYHHIHCNNLPMDYHCSILHQDNHEDGCFHSLKLGGLDIS